MTDLSILIAMLVLLFFNAVLLKYFLAHKLIFPRGIAYGEIQIPDCRRVLGRGFSHQITTVILHLWEQLLRFSLYSLTLMETLLWDESLFRFSSIDLEEKRVGSNCYRLFSSRLSLPHLPQGICGFHAALRTAGP